VHDLQAMEPRPHVRLSGAAEMSVPMRLDDPCYWMLSDDFTTTPVVFHKGCYIYAKTLSSRKWACRSAASALSAAATLRPTMTLATIAGM
jgi:hypothetical protein